MKKMLHGLEHAQRVFRRAPRVHQEKIAHALNVGAREIKDRAEILVPEDTGDLKQDIKVEARGLQVRRGGRALVARVIAGTSAGNAMAAFRSEFGRAPSPDGHPGHAPQSFFFTAYHSVRKRVRGRVKRSINAAAKALARVR